MREIFRGIRTSRTQEGRKSGTRADSGGILLPGRWRAFNHPRERTIIRQLGVNFQPERIFTNENSFRRNHPARSSPIRDCRQKLFCAAGVAERRVLGIK